jgi:regulator of protease activity HflC (stomatin/prohibitin superfamily)
MFVRQVDTGRHVVITAWERAVVLRDGAVARVEGAGRHRRQRRESWRVLDVRPRLLIIPPQEVLTSDGLQVRVSLFLTASVADAELWLTGSVDVGSELHALAQRALRTVVAAHTLEELLAARDSLTGELATIRQAAARFGAAIESFEVRDLTLPQELRQAYSATALAKAEGAAKLERARGEAAAVRSLANTAQVLEAHPSLLQLRALESAGHIVVKIVPAGEVEPA